MTFLFRSILPWSGKRFVDAIFNLTGPDVDEVKGNYVGVADTPNGPCYDLVDIEISTYRALATSYIHATNSNRLDLVIGESRDTLAVHDLNVSHSLELLADGSDNRVGGFRVDAVGAHIG